MAINLVNPYSGNEEETCSVSFAAQQTMGAHHTGSAQTEAEYNKSKQLGEWGVILAKLYKGQVPDGTKLVTYTNPTGVRGYFYYKGKKIHQKNYSTDGKSYDLVATPVQVENYIKGSYYQTAIPRAVNDKSDKVTMPGAKVQPEFTSLEAAGVLAPGSEFIYHGEAKAKYLIVGKHVVVKEHPLPSAGKKARILVEKDTGVQVGQQAGSGAKWWIEKIEKETKPAPVTVAVPTPATPVNAGSTSVGSMSHEDVSAMFVKIKDDLAKEKGLNIKGANPELDQQVYSAIGEKTGYTAAEVKGKIDAYKAEGNKLSALKKKVLAGTKKVPEGKATPTKATPAAPLNVSHATNKPAADPKPNGVPTVATPKLADEVKAAVVEKVEAQPAKHYSDEDVAAAYIIAKDAIVASNTKGWTLYTKSEEMDLEIAIQVGLKTGLNPFQQKAAIANYLAGGKKLSSLKKQLAKQGAFTPKADTLKKSGAAKTLDDKKKEAEAKADAGYTPAPAPSAGTPPVETGKPAPKRVEAEAHQAGDISGISSVSKKLYFEKFKGQLGKSYLSSTAGYNYEAFATTLAQLKQDGAPEDLTLLQLVRVIDEYGAQKAGVDNGKLFEKKVITWLTTPEGTQYVKDVEAQLAKDIAEKAAKAKIKAEADAAAKLLQDKQPPLPADSALFQEMTPSKALEFQREMLRAKPFGPGEKSGLVHYTGSAYTEMNGYLRGRSSYISERSKKAIEQASRGMRPSTEHMLLRRGTGFIQFGEGIDGTNIWGLTGKTLEDKGFLSTSAAGRAAFGGQVAMEIEAPKGTMGMYVDKLMNDDGTTSRFSSHPGENEWLLQKGTKYKVLNVRKEGSTFIVRLRVVN